MTSIVERLRKMYDRGIITKNHLFISVQEEGDPADLDDLGSYKDEFLEILDNSPRTDEEWSKTMFLNAGVVYSNRYQLPQTQDEQRAYNRAGVEKWRSALGRT